MSVGIPSFVGEETGMIGHGEQVNQVLVLFGSNCKDLGNICLLKKSFIKLMNFGMPSVDGYCFGCHWG